MVDKLKNAAYEIMRKNRKESTMKKKLVMLLLCGVMACSFTACGNGDSKGTEISEVSSKTDGKRSGEYKIDVTKQVTSLAEYNGIKLDMDSSLEVTEDAMNNYLTTLLSGYGAEAFEEDKDHDVVERKDGLFSARYYDKYGKRKEKCFDTLPEAKNWLADAK